MNCKSIPVLVAMTLILPLTSAQTPTPQSVAKAGTQLPTFEVATIRPIDPKSTGPVGFYSYPGGRVHLGFTTVELLLYFAYDVKPFQIAGGPPWIASDRYDIEAVPPESSPSRAQKMAPFKIAPTGEQQQMLQSLLADRFAFKSHLETREGPVYLLTRGGGRLELQEPADKDADWRGTVVDKGGIFDGEAFGSNISMANLADVLTRLLGFPVLDQTALPGTYDFHLTPDDPQNTDKEDAIFDAMHRLGLNLKRSKGPIQTLVVDHIERPSEN